jgi:uncharacterized membrane protein YeaQ/YmgE (transglycosylase-associated protein family)
MSSVIIDLIVLVVAGIVGGNAVGTWPKYDLGEMWNTITGAVGGAVGGEVLQAAMQFIGVGSGVGSLITPVVGGCVAGAIFTMLFAIFKGADS